MGILQQDLTTDILEDRFWHAYMDDEECAEISSSHQRLIQAIAEDVALDDAHKSLVDLLARALSMSLTDRGRPTFQPYIRMGNRRSPALEDFDSRDAEALFRAAQKAPSDALRARLADVAASADRTHWQAGTLAANAYLELAEKALLAEDAYQVLTEFKRGMRLSTAYCRQDRELQRRYFTLLQRAIHHHLAGDSTSVALTLCEDIPRSESDALKAAAEALEAAASRLKDGGDIDSAARCYDKAHILWRWVGRGDDSKRCHLLRGETLVERAMGGGMAMLRSHWLGEAIQILRQAGATRERVDELRRELARLERESLDDFHPIEHSTDITEAVRAVEAALIGPSMMDALLQMAFELTRWPSHDKVRESVLERARNSPLSTIFGTQHVNAQGVTIAQSAPLDTADEESVYGAMVQSTRDFEFHFTARVILLRSADIIFTNYHPKLHHVLELLESSPLTPPGREHSLARGLLAGFEGDWLEAAAYLIPQAEPYVRHLFQQQGIITLAMREGGIQSEKNLSELLDSPEAQGIFGRDLLLTLKTILVHPLGYKLRHNWAHGLTTESEMLNSGLVSLWWALWRLTLWPIAHEIYSNAQPAPAEGPEAPAADKPHVGS